MRSVALIRSAVTGALLALVASFLWSCTGDQAPVAPTEEEIEIFTEIVLIEAALQDFVGMRGSMLTERYYGQLYDRHGISARDLDELRDRYDADARLWQIMTDSVEARLTRAQEDPSALLTGESD